MTTTELLTHDITHQHAGNAFAVVEIVDGDFVRLTNKYLPDRERDRGYLAWRKKLSITQRKIDFNDPNSPIIKIELTPDELKAIGKIREAVASGKKRYHETHLVKV